MSSTRILSTLEDLSNEVIYEIFDFLDVYHVYNGFNKLNKRFDYLVHHSNLPLNINMSFLSRANFRRYLSDMILPNSQRIRSLHLHNQPMFEEMFSSSENVQKFSEVQTIILNNMITFTNFNWFASFPNLSSLIIKKFRCQSIIAFISQSATSLPALKYCQISIDKSVYFNYSSTDLNEQSTIEHLVIHGNCQFGDLSYLLSYLPRLHRLSIDSISNDYIRPSLINILPSNQLTHLSLKLKDIEFHRFENYFSCLPSSLQVFRLSCDEDRNYLDANRWERLIRTYLPNLRIWDFQHTCAIRNDPDRVMYEDSIKQFTSPFWINRNWYFGYQSGKRNDNSSYYTFYSVKSLRYVVDRSVPIVFSSFRRRSHVLYGEYHHPHRLSSSDLNSIDHLEIMNASPVNDCPVSFGNIQQLTLSSNYQIKNTPSFIFVLDRIIPLKQLRKIHLHCSSLPLNRLIQLISATPHCSHLELTGQLTGELSLSSVKNHLSQITNLQVTSVCTIDHLKILTKICSQIQHLSIYIREEQLRIIMEYLLSSCHRYTQQLTSLYLRSTGDIYIEKLQHMLTISERSKDFLIEDIGYKISHIWL